MRPRFSIQCGCLKGQNISLMCQRIITAYCYSTPFSEVKDLSAIWPWFSSPILGKCWNPSSHFQQKIASWDVEIVKSLGMLSTHQHLCTVVEHRRTLSPGQVRLCGGRGKYLSNPPSKSTIYSVIFPEMSLTIFVSFELFEQSSTVHRKTDKTPPFGHQVYRYSAKNDCIYNESI